MTVYDGFQCERLAAAILQENGYVCEVAELRTHRYTSGDGGEQYQNRVDYFGEFDVIAIPSGPIGTTKLLQVTRNQKKQEREEDGVTFGGANDVFREMMDLVAELESRDGRL